MKHKRIWFENRIGKEVWQDGDKHEPIAHGNIIIIRTTPILNKITITKQNMESLYISQTEKRYKYYDL